METVHAVKNQYLGINAHLQSQFQAEGGWDSFHTLHIGHLAAALQVQLRGLGYAAVIEESLQIRRVGEPDRYPISDILITDQESRRAAQAHSATAHSGVATLSASLMLDLSDDDLSYYHAVAIYEGAARQGDPVAWIELLSPSNKPTGRDFDRYHSKRKQILQSDIVFVEMDYLHEQPTTYWRLPSYALRKEGQQPEDGASPYLITVIDPRPSLRDAEGQLHRFFVDEPLPVVDIPLNIGDRLNFDFSPPYNQSFEAMFYGDRVDNTQLPVNFERYRETDQTRIVARMLAVLEAAQAGHDLEQPPQPVATLPLEVALKRLESLVST